MFRKFIMVVFLCSPLYSHSQNTGNTYMVTYRKDSKLIKDSLIVIKDTGLQNMINALIKGTFNSNDQRWMLRNDTLYNKKGLPEVVKLGDSIWGATIERLTYDSLNRLTAIIGYNSKGKVKPYWEDRAMETYKYNRYGNKIEERYFDENLKPSREELTGPAITRYKYNDKGQKTEELYFDEKDNPLADFAKVEYVYDTKGNLISKEEYNTKGEKIK